MVRIDRASTPANHPRDGSLDTTQGEVAVEPANGAGDNELLEPPRRFTVNLVPSADWEALPEAFMRGNDVSQDQGHALGVAGKLSRVPRQSAPGDACRHSRGLFLDIILYLRRQCGRYSIFPLVHHVTSVLGVRTRVWVDHRKGVRGSVVPGCPE